MARVEELTGEPGRRTYRRTLRLPYGTGIVAVDEASPDRGWRPGSTSPISAT